MNYIMIKSFCTKMSNLSYRDLDIGDLQQQCRTEQLEYNKQQPG